MARQLRALSLLPEDLGLHFIMSVALSQVTWGPRGCPLAPTLGGSSAPPGLAQNQEHAEVGSSVHSPSFAFIHLSIHLAFTHSPFTQRI